jgi:hypothetical protein
MDNFNALTEAEANAVYDVLVEHAGEQEDEYSREMFVDAQVSDFQPEYRFMGVLGFGGKFRRRTFNDEWYVDCYPENLNKERKVIIQKTNEALVALRAQLRN